MLRRTPFEEDRHSNTLALFIRWNFTSPPFLYPIYKDRVFSLYPFLFPYWPRLIQVLGYPFYNLEFRSLSKNEVHIENSYDPTSKTGVSEPVRTKVPKRPTPSKESDPDTRPSRCQDPKPPSGQGYRGDP